MAKKKSRARGIPNVVVLLAVVAALAFLAGEAWLRLRSEAGQLWLARFGLGERARIVQLVSRQIHRGLDTARVPADSLRETPSDTGAVALRWRVGLAPGASAIQLNYAITDALAKAGATVFSGRESPGRNGELIVTLRVGIGVQPTHDVVIVRPPVSEEAPEKESGRLAIVLYGFGDDPVAARETFALPVPFAVAIAPGTKASAEIFKLAHERQREIVVHLPLEPLNYPRINPGPGTITVTMSPSQITGKVRHSIEQSGGAVALANHMGSLATQDMEVMSAIYRELKRAGLPFVHVQPAPGAVCKPLASRLGVVYDEPDELLETEGRAKDTKALDRRWKALLVDAQKRGTVVAWIRVSPLVREWLPKATSAKRLGGVNLVPLTSASRRPVTL